MLTHDIYRVCCCLSSYSSYQDILEEHATSKALTATSLLVLQEKAGYRTCNEGEEPSAPASAPSSSSFEPDTSENEAEPQKLAEDNQNSVANSNKNVVANTDIAVAKTGIAVANTGIAVANTNTTVANTDTAVANTGIAVANIDPAVDNSNTEDITNLNHVMRNKTGRNTKDQAADAADSMPGDGTQLASWHPASFAMAQATSRPHTTGRESGDPIPSRSRTTSSEQGYRVRKTSSLDRIRDKVETEERNTTARTQAGSLFHALVAKDPDGKGTEITTRESRAQRKAERRQARKEGRTSEDKTEEVKKEEERPVTASSLFHALLPTEQKKNEEQLIRESSQRTAQRAEVTAAPRQERPVRMDKESLKQKTEDYVANIPLSKSTDHEPRSRDKSQERSRDKSQERSRDKSQERSRDKSQERSRDKSQERSRERSHEKSRERSQERSRERSQDEGGSTGDLVIRPIQRILEVLSGTIEIERSAPDTPDTQQDPETEPTLVLDKEENAEEKEIEEEEEEEEEEDESINYSDIPTDEISTDPSSEEEEEEVEQNKYLKHAFFPEVYDGEDSDSYPYKRPFTLKSPTANRQKSGTLNNRYPVYIPSESSSSLATDDLSSESEEDQEGEEELSSHISDLEQEEEDDMEEPLEGNETEGELEEELEESGTGEDVRYDDPDLVETDSAFSFSGRISPAPLNEGNDNEEEIEELEGTNVDQEDTGPPAPSSPGPSTVVGSIVTASSGTFTELRNEDERKRGGGLMKRFKKRVMKK